MRKKTLFTALLLAATLSIHAAGYQQQGQFVSIALQSQQLPDGKQTARQVRLQVVADKIIRVEATPDEQFPQKQSLIIVPQTQKTKYTVVEEGSCVVVKTAAVEARVDKQTGHIEFRDAEGKLLLSEIAQGGKTFKPFLVPERELGTKAANVSMDARRGWTWHTQFDSPDDEAFYGLGQHQAEELNMKGLNEELFQYNTKVSVPMVVSNRGYGILWDSYSFCRFGNPDDYQQLNHAFTLYDKQGRHGGLTGTYRDARGQTITRQEDSLYFEHQVPAVNAEHDGDLGIDALPKGFLLDGAHVIYEGYIEAPQSANYHFLLYYAGYMRVYLDGHEVVKERWRTAWNPNSWKFTFPMLKGRRVPLRIEWEPDGGVSYCGLRAATPRTEEEQGRLSIWSEMAKDMDYYFIAGPTIDQVISGYRTLTGRAPVYPKWVLGFWQSRERYKTSAEIEQTLKEFRDRKIPVDNIVQDWNYWKLENWGDHTFEAARFPNPQAMLDSVHQMGGRFMISVWPKFYDTIDNYKELDSHGWIYQQAITDDIHDWLGFRGSFYDAYDANARKTFWRQMNENLYTKYRYGIDAWWMDASEPNVRDCTPMWYRKALSGPTALGTSTEYFNAYSIVNADAIYNGQRSVFKKANLKKLGLAGEPRVFLLTRSGFAGEQRYSTATWSGDIGTRWEDMRSQMTAGLNYSISGLPFWGMDQGGFSVESRYVKAQQLYDETGQENADLTEWRELQVRWNQFGCFIPLYRAHGQWPLREVWNIAPRGHRAYETIVWYDRLRYHLMPYLYSMAGWVNTRDYTMMRPLVMDFQDDPAALNIKDQWMFGPSLMACPVGYYKARQREVYLPEGRTWFDFYSGQSFEGGQTINAPAPLERMPVFVPSGSIIPFGPELQWSDEKPAETINLYVYAGRDAQFQLYEDEGTNYNYERGQRATIDIKWNDQARRLDIGQRVGSFPGMLKERHFNVVLVTADDPVELDLKSPTGRLVKYNGKAVSMQF